MERHPGRWILRVRQTLGMCQVRVITYIPLREEQDRQPLLLLEHGDPILDVVALRYGEGGESGEIGALDRTLRAHSRPCARCSGELEGFLLLNMSFSSDGSI